MPGVYISFPFCSQKCTFCNFASGVFPKSLETEYLEILEREIASHDWRWTPDTIYLGGGTPSQMDTGALSRILSQIPGRPWAEATMEAAPGSLTPDRVRAWTQAGINRVSLGVQSFVIKELTQTGRKHTAETVASDCELLRVHNISNINIDLIAGLPFQTLESWQESLNVVVKLGVPHVSVYMLEVDEDSRLGLQILQDGPKYGAGQCPADDLTAHFYSSAVETLAGNGIQRYEISNFARPGFESLHNLKYWLRLAYIGFGADAHSFDGERRWGNVETPAEYIERGGIGQSVRGDDEDAHPAEERFFLGLRLDRGVQPDAQDWVRFAQPIEKFLSLGLLSRDGDTLRLSEQGVLFSNEVFQEFIEV